MEALDGEATFSGYFDTPTEGHCSLADLGFQTKAHHCAETCYSSFLPLST